MRCAVSAWICSAMARPSMRLDGATSGNSLERIDVDDWSVRPAFVQQFLARDHDAPASEIFEDQIGGGTVEIINGLAAVQALQREVSRGLDAHAALHETFTVDNSLNEGLLHRSRWRCGRRHHLRSRGCGGRS